VKASASSRWRERALAAEAERNETQRKYDELLDRLTAALAGALVAGGYVPEHEHMTDEERTI
jgi:hypothetical protein